MDGVGKGAHAIYADAVYYSGFVAMALTLVIAFWRGGRLEKQVASVVGVAWIASAFAPNDNLSLSSVIFAIDIALMLYLFYCAAFSRRLWPMAAAAFQLLIVATHVSFALRVQLEQWGYFTAYYLWSWSVLACIVVGSLRAKSRTAT